MKTAPPPSQPDPEQTPSSESRPDEIDTPPPIPLSPHNADDAARLEQDIVAALAEKPDTIEEVAARLDDLNQLLARLLMQKTGVRPPAPAVLGPDDVLLSCVVTLRDQQGVLKHLDVSAPMYGVLADSELTMAHNTLTAVLSMLIIRPLSTAWTQHVSSRMHRPQLILRVKEVSDNVIPGTEEDEPSAIERTR